MKSFLLLIIACGLLLCKAGAQGSPAYYEGTSGLSGLRLKGRLHHILSKRIVSWNYGDLPEKYEITDRDSFYEHDGSLLDLYSENPLGTDPYNYTYEVPSLISGASTEGLGWNREHIVSQSFFDSYYPMYSDMHFVIPTDARVNQRRSNLPFGEVGSTTTFVSLNGSKTGLSISPGYTLTVFEPIDEFKGDIARMILYASVRYESLIPYFETDNSRCPFEEREEIAVKKWMLDQLMAWHHADPVSPRETARNNNVYIIQGNRNPFIDHPEWVDAIWNTGVTDTEAPDEPVFPEVINKGKSFIHLSWAASPAPDILGYEVYRDGTLMGVTKNNYFVFTGLLPATSYSLSLKSYDAAYNKSGMSVAITVNTESSDTFSTDLFFSKIIEGSAHNKAIEITNTTGHPVDLRSYTIDMQQVNTSTGALYWSDNGYRMEGELPHGRKAVLLHPGFDLICFEKDSADFITAATPLTFNGTLALRLQHNYNTIDYFGTPGHTEPFAEDSSFYRLASVRQPNTTFTYAEWESHPVDYCEDLGNTDTATFSSQLLNRTSFSFFPNPVKRGGVLYIEGKNLGGIHSFVLTDVQGRTCVREERPFRSKNYIHIPDVAAGVYILVLDGTALKLLVTD